MSYQRRGQMSYENNEKDALIATMKKQLYQLTDLDHQYSKLKDDLKVLESKYSMLQDDNQRIQSQFKVKADINRTTILQHRNQLDGLKMQVHKAGVQIDDVMRQIGNLKRVRENRENQITSQISYNQDFEKANNQQIDVNINLNNKIKSLKQNRNRAENQCERLNKILDEQIAQLKSLEKDARNSQSSNQRYQSIINLAQTDHNQLTDDLKIREEQVSTTRQKLSRLEQEREQFKEKNNKLNKECIKSDSQLRNVSMDLENCMAKNKELSNRLKNQDKILRKSGNQLEQSHLRRQALLKEHDNVSTEHKVLNNEIDRCLETILEYEKVNDELQRHLRTFSQCDEEARSMLNRKDAISNVLEQINSKIHKTKSEIQHLR